MEYYYYYYNNKSRRSQQKIAAMLLLIVWIMMLLSHGRSDDAKDKEECTNSLVGLATCLPYVEGQSNAKVPTPDCCNGLKQILKTNKKCLCYVVKHRSDPDLGLNINATLALGLPTVCQAHADVTQCPALLHMDPKSADAQVFYQFGKGTSSKNVGSPASSPIAIGSGAPGPGAAQVHKNGGDDHRGKEWFRLEVFITVLLSYVMSA